MIGVTLTLMVLTACGDRSERGDLISKPARSTTVHSVDAADTTNAPDDTDAATADGDGIEESGSVRWTPCGDYECARVTVPLRYSPDGTAATEEELELALIRKPSTGRAVGTLFVNPGGPGASGVDFVRAGFDLGPEIGSRFHLVGFDPRGVGASAGLQCGEEARIGPRPDSSPDDEREQQVLEDEARSMAEQCARLDNPLVANISTSIAARDLDRLRRAVGDGTLTYYGLSYGTLLGLRYAELHPQRVGHMVLDGVIDPSLDLQALLRLQATAFEEAFVELDRLCGTPSLARCPEDGLAETFDRLRERLETEGPIGQFGSTELSYAALVALYSPDLWPLLARGLADADEPATVSDVTTLQELHNRMSGAVQFTSYAAYLCRDFPVSVDRDQWRSFADELSTLAPRFGATVANELLTCVYWPTARDAGPEPNEVADGAPILIIGTTRDPATPLIGAERVAGTLERARLVVVEGFHHTAIGYNPCAVEIVERYVIESTLPSPGTRCLQNGAELVNGDDG